ncbi:olpB [Symbiodinium natans]|uniref:OlpB protein n=1 Tax=Symbiodinium natans TaxID=878477 RepID=A0A812N5R4_9DINO|nr:olpB [Symbiodinium natans]
MSIWSFLLLCAAAIGTSRACSCDPEDIRAHEDFSSPAVKFFRQPFVFAGKVLSIQPADGMPGEQSAYCAAPPAAHHEDEEWGNPCAEDDEGHFRRWNRCRRKHIAEVQVTHGFQGISKGEIFRYNCTLASCGDCSADCPEVGAEVLDGTRAGGATSICRSQLCVLSGWDTEHCQRLLKELQRKRPAESRKFQIALPVAFSTLTANSYFRGQLLRSLVEDVLADLWPEVSKFDIKSANLVEDPHRSVLVTPSALVPSTLFEIVCYMADQEDVAGVESVLRGLFSVPFTWKKGWDIVKQFCLHSPCPQCETTCVESSQTSLVSLPTPIFA